MKLWNKSRKSKKIYKCNIFKGICICKRKEKCVIGRCITLSSESILTIAMVCIFSTMLIGSVIHVSNSKIDICKTDEDMWIPTKEDIAYQDSMYTIIQTTQDDITEIKEDIVIIIERLDYEDDTSDSIRYVKNGPIDKRRN